MIAELVVIAACSWNNPGADPYRGDLAVAIDSYQEIPVEVRADLKKKIRSNRYDDVVTITRNGIQGGEDYESSITKMHFGRNKVCLTVDRSGWKPSDSQGALVYRVGEWAILRPGICNNISIVKIKGQPKDIDPPPFAELPPPDQGIEQKLALPEELPNILPDDPNVTYSFVPPSGAVPEPSSWSLTLLGLLGIGWLVRKRNSK